MAGVSNNKREYGRVSIMLLCSASDKVKARITVVTVKSINFLNPVIKAQADRADACLHIGEHIEHASNRPGCSPKLETRTTKNSKYFYL